jgi:hypothetical protein
MHGLPIRKIPGIGRVSERLLDSIGVKVRRKILENGPYFAYRPSLTLCLGMWGHPQMSRRAVATG